MTWNFKQQIFSQTLQITPSFSLCHSSFHHNMFSDNFFYICLQIVNILWLRNCVFFLSTSSSWFKIFLTKHVCIFSWHPLHIQQMTSNWNWEIIYWSNHVSFNNSWLTLHKSKWENKLFCWKVCFLWLKTNWLTNISWPLQFMRQLELLIVDNGIFLFELELKKSVAISLNIWEVSQCFWNIIVVTRYS